MYLTKEMKELMMNNDLTFSNNTSKKGYAFTITWLIIIIQFIGLILLVIRQSEQSNIKLIALSVGFILATLISNIYIPKLTKGDNTLVYIVNMLYSIGLLLIMRLNANTGTTHILWYIMAFFGFILVYLILSNYMKFLKNKFWFYFTITLMTFIVTLVLAKNTDGARNWIRITEGITIQLSEFAKISYIFMIASFYGDYEKFESEKYGKYYLNIATYIFIGLFFLQGELGTAMVFFATFIISMFVFEKDYVRMFINVLLAFLGLFIAYKLFGHIRVRFDIWLDPWADYHGRGYQIVQGLFAVASGGMFGKGLGLGTPNMIPVATSDFIIPAIIEEMGVFMGIGIILLYTILIYKGIKIALTNSDRFFSSLAFGVTLVFASQSLVMFGGVLKLIPLTGITTPFMSYGGSSTLANFILLAVLQYTASKKVSYE